MKCYLCEELGHAATECCDFELIKGNMMQQAIERIQKLEHLVREQIKKRYTHRVGGDLKRTEGYKAMVKKIQKLNLNKSSQGSSSVFTEIQGGGSGEVSMNNSQKWSGQSSSNLVRKVNFLEPVSHIKGPYTALKRSSRRVDRILEVSDEDEQ